MLHDLKNFLALADFVTNAANLRFYILFFSGLVLIENVFKSGSNAQRESTVVLKNCETEGGILSEFTGIYICFHLVIT